VVVLDRRGKPVREFPAGGADGTGRPTGVLVAGGSCYVADAGGKRIESFTLDGRPLAAWGSQGDGPAQFRAPFRIAQDGLGRVLVTDALNSRVLAFTPAGEPLASFGEFGATEGTLFRPAGLAVLGGDRVLVSDNYFGSLQIFDAQGVYQGVLCGSDGQPLALEHPTGVAARGAAVFVVEMGAGRVSGWEIGAR
jgi:DNA-binding beta-propeller fold protein YncE